MSGQSLVEYISSLLSQGYTEAQIRQTLLQNNYPQSMIDTAFAALGQQVQERVVTSTPPTSVVDQLTSYLRTYLAQGYDAQALRQTLLQQGYSPGDVDRALAAATGQHVTVEHHIAGSTILKLAVLLLFLGGVTYGIISLSALFQHPTPQSIHRLLDVSLSLDESSVQPGATLHATTSVTNMGSGKYDVTLTYQFLDSKGRELWSERKTKAIATSFDDTERIPVDEELPDGTYTVRVSAEYGGESPAESTAHVTVKNDRTGGGSASGGTASEENTSTTIFILQDEKENARDQAFAAAKAGESTKAEQLCKSITNQARHDDCLTTITSYDQSASHCDAIRSDEKRDSCLMSFIINGQYNLCPKLTQQSNKELCENLQHLNNLPSTSTPEINQYATPVTT